jgi:putative ABC transport system permease protein
VGAVVVQARADLRARPWQVALIGLVVAVAGALLALGLTGARLSGGGYERLFERTNGAHVWVYVDGEAVTPEMAEAAVRAVRGVEAATPAMLTVTFTTDGLSQPLFGALAAREWQESLRVAPPLLVAGRPPAAPDEMVVDRNAAEQLGLAEGDHLPVTGRRGTVAARVVGLSVTAEACPYPLCNPTAVYVAPGAHDALGLTPAAAPGMARLAIGLRLTDPASVDEAAAAVQRELPPSTILLVRDWRDTRTYANFAFSFQAALLVVFSAIAMLVAGVLIAVTIGGAVRAETRRIGILKAVGFTGRQVRGVYLVQYLGVVAVAAVAGTVAARAAAPSLMGSVAARFGDSAVGAPVVQLALVPLALVVAAAVFVVLPVRRAVRMDAVRAIRDDGAARPARHGGLVRRLPLAVGRGVADVVAAPARSLLVAVALAATATTFSFAAVASASVDAFLHDPAVGAVPDGDILLRRSARMGTDEALRVVRDHPGVEAAVVEHLSHFHVRGDAAPYVARFRTGDVSAFRRPILAGRDLRGPDEVVVGYGLADDQGLAPGERVTVLVAGEERAFTVAGVYREFAELGRTMAMQAGVVPETGYAPAALWVRVRDGADAAEVGRELAAATRGALDPLLVRDLIPDMIFSMRDVVRALLVVLAALTALGVLSCVLLGVQEQRRSLGLLKAVGMTPRHLAVSVLSGTGLLALVGVALGVPFGAVGTRVSTDAMLRSLGFGPFEAPIRLGDLAPVAPLVVAVALLGAWLPARRAAAVPVVETLRYE